VGLVSIDVSGVPYPHIVIGVACILLLASAIVYYLRGGRVEAILEKATSVKTKAPSKEDVQPEI